jgi:hypothetical protein
MPSRPDEGVRGHPRARGQRHSHAARVTAVDETKLTDDEAETMLRRLSKHYHCPVMPIERYCEALRTWARVYGESGSKRAEQIDYVFLQISKSCLLDRLLYGGEKLRTRKCPDPDHDGHWRGLESPGNYCKHGCGFTGWLPEPEDASPYPPGVFLCTSADGSVLEKDRKPYEPGPGEPSLAEYLALRSR